MLIEQNNCMTGTISAVRISLMVDLCRHDPTVSRVAINKSVGNCGPTFGTFGQSEAGRLRVCDWLSTVAD